MLFRNKLKAEILQKKARAGIFINFAKNQRNLKVCNETIITLDSKET